MTFEHYQQLADEMLNEYLEAWPEWDITIPSFAQAQEQEQERLLLENKIEGKEKMKVTKIEDLQKKISEAFGEPQREIEDRRIYYEEIAEEDRIKAEAKELTGAEKRYVRKTLDEVEVIDHTLDADFEEAFGSSSHKVEKLDDLQESIGNASEGRILLESATVDFCDSNGSKPFKFSGKGFQVDTINKNGRRYPRNLVEEALRAVKGKRLSVMAGHPAPNTTDPSIVVGSITLGEIDADNWVRYSGTLSETRKGKDLQILLRDENIGDISLRSRGRTKEVKVDGQVVEQITALSLKGLDLVVEGSFENAGVGEIL